MIPTDQIMKKISFVLLITILHMGTMLSSEKQPLPTVMEETWKEFRQIHPYGYQTVALKHIGKDCIFIISEPSESVTPQMLNSLFSEYGGNMTIMHQPLGFQGWLADAVGKISFPDENKFKSFTHDLFTLLYGTDYKAYYTDLDNPAAHTYFAEHRLNYSISASEISAWMIDGNEKFIISTGTYRSLPEILNMNTNKSNELFYSKDRGFVAWIVNTKRIDIEDPYFKENARKFALDTDLIIGAIGKIGKQIAIIAREREVPVTVLPPLRIEMLQLLATTDNDHLAQSFEMFNVFAGKNSKNEDMAPIYLSNELWHTEYGNLLNMTDQMLKSWSENNTIHDYNYNYPSPLDWPFEKGVFHTLNASDQLTYNWNTAGAGYVIQNKNALDVFAVNRTGSLPVSYIPEGMEETVNDKIVEAEELAYDFFSELNSPELVREVQYATIYQIFRYFRKAKQTGSQIVSTTNQNSINRAPYVFFENIVYNLLKFAADTTTAEFKRSYAKGLDRFIQKRLQTNTETHFDKLIEQDPYGNFYNFMVDQFGYEFIDIITANNLKQTDIQSEFDNFLFPALQTIQEYINDYVNIYGAFPFRTAAKIIVNKDYFTNQYQRYIDLDNHWRGITNQEFNDYNKKVDELNQLIESYTNDLKAYRKATLIGKEPPISTTELTKQLAQIKSLEAGLDSKRRIAEKRKSFTESNYKSATQFFSLKIDHHQEMALGALNWLLTDPTPFEAPIGEFYASRFTTHRQWIKSSPITKSTSIRSGIYGGHNLDARITPIQISSTIPKGICRISETDRGKVISVSEADKARITPTILRTIERRSIKGDFQLPPSPTIRSKTILLGENEVSTTRGFDNKLHNKGNTRKLALVNGKEITSVAALQDVIADEISKAGKSSIKEIHFKNFSAREVYAYADELKECILERLTDESINLKNFDINEDMQVISQKDGTVKLILKQREETISQENTYKAATLHITVPDKSAESLKDAILNLFKLPEYKIDNRFKWKRELRKELQKTHPEIDSYDIQDEFIQLYGHILNPNNYEILQQAV